MEINAYNNLNTSNLTADSKSASPYSSTTSLFNKLLSDNSDEIENVSSVQGLGLNDKVQNAIRKLNEDVMSTSSGKSNTHDELTLMLALRKQAS